MRECLARELLVPHAGDERVDRGYCKTFDAEEREGEGEMGMERDREEGKTAAVAS
jgi:hypothetical protein